MLKLQGTVEPLGKGLHRTCYPHPEFPDRCIKVVHNFGKGGAKEIVREISYYEHLQTYLADWSGLPCYYGTVETDCGKGYIYDRIIDFDGQASRTLQATYDGKTLHLVYAGGEHNLSDLIDFIKAKNIKYNKIFSELPTLNDVFLELTGKDLRD